LKFEYFVDEEYAGRELKSILKNKFEFSEKLIKKLKYNNKVLCNGNPVYINSTVKPGDVVEAIINFDEESENIVPEKMNLRIIFEDDCLIALDKQPGMVVHPTSSHLTGTIANGLVYYFSEKGIRIKIRPVSRLDRDTSGIIIFAKNQFVQEEFIKQMNTNTFKKEYIGVVNGVLTKKTGTIDLPIDRKPDSIMLRHISKSGFKSVTRFKVIEYLKNATYLSFYLETGRTHQIRVHCQAIGHPLFGDTLYSDIKTGFINRQALHSSKVEFIHPLTKQTIQLFSPIPSDIKTLLEILRK
jgi:23S rRNA pseudouridine1911/1915/1917 synthase